MNTRTYTYFLIADHHGNARLRSRKPTARELSPPEHLFTVRLVVPEPVRQDMTVTLTLPQAPNGGTSIEGQEAEPIAAEEQAG